MDWEERFLNWVCILAWLADVRDGNRDAMTILRFAIKQKANIKRGNSLELAMDFVSYFQGEYDINSFHEKHFLTIDYQI